MRKLFESELRELQWSDLADVVERELEESSNLEFKVGLSSKGDNQDPWMIAQKKIGDQARDKIAKEIVAFANSYGGVLIVGIEESDENPKRAIGFGAPIPKCIDLAERLHQMLRDRIDPPLDSLEIRGIEKPECEGAGAIVIRVGGSTSAPHGLGRPPEAYLRRGASAEPMTMRDIQNRFWEARTARERVLQRQLSRKEALNGLISKKQNGLLQNLNNETIPPAHPHLAFMCTVLPEKHLELFAIAKKLRAKGFLRPYIDCGVAPQFGEGGFPFHWTPMAHGSSTKDENHRCSSVWSIFDDGLIDIAAIIPCNPNRDIDVIYPGCLCVNIAQLMLMARKLGLQAHHPGVPFVVECAIKTYGVVPIFNGGRYDTKNTISEIDTNFGPFSFASIGDLKIAYAHMERELWYSLGIAQIEELPIDFDKIASEYLKPTASG